LFQLEVGRLSGLFLISAMCFFTRSLCATVGVFHVFLLNRLFVYNGAWRWLRLFQNRVFKLSLEPTQHVRSGPELLNTMNITEDHPQEVWLDYVGLLRSNIYIYIYFFSNIISYIFILYVYIYMCVCVWATLKTCFSTGKLRHRNLRSPGFVTALKAFRAIRMEPLAAVEGEARCEDLRMWGPVWPDLAVKHFSLRTGKSPFLIGKSWYGQLFQWAFIDFL
jgi:hypothetical protein